MVEDRIKLQQYLKRPIKNMAKMVQSLVYSSDRVWCLISDTPNVIEIDVDKRLPTYIFTMDEFLAGAICWGLQGTGGGMSISVGYLLGISGDVLTSGCTSGATKLPPFLSHDVESNAFRLASSVSNASLSGFNWA
jgi:hypothetical protein